MAFSINRITLLGNIGQEPEHRYTTSNISVTTFSLATTHSYKDREGEWVNETTWHNVTGFNLSEYIKEKMHKGAKFFIEGRITKRSYTDKQDVKRYITEVIIEKIIPLEAVDSDKNNPQHTTRTNTNSDANDNSENQAEQELEQEDDLPF